MPTPAVLANPSMLGAPCTPGLVQDDGLQQDIVLEEECPPSTSSGPSTPAATMSATVTKDACPIIFHDNFIYTQERLKFQMAKELDGLLDSSETEPAKSCIICDGVPILFEHQRGVSTAGVWQVYT